MAEFTKVSSMADLPKLESEKEQVIKMVEEIIAKIRSTGAAEIKLSGAGSSKEILAAAQEVQKAQAGLVQSTKQYEQALKQTAQTEKTAAQIKKELATAAKQEAAAKKEAALAAKAEAAAVKESNLAKKAEAQAAKEAALTKAANARAAKELALAELQNTKTATELAKAKEIEQRATIGLAREKERLEKAATRERQNAEKLGNAYEQLKKKYEIAANSAKTFGAQFGSNSAEFQEAAAAAQKYYQELIKIEGAVGQSQRKVGQYENATFALSQTFRELPAFANSIQTGLMGISNNLPMVADGFNQLRAQGLGVAQSFRIMAASLFSFANVLTLGISLILFFWKDIKNLIGVSRDLIETNKKLAESSAKVTDALAEESQAWTKIRAARLEAMKTDQQAQEAGGIQAVKNFALRKKLAAEELSLAEFEAQTLAGNLTGRAVFDKKQALNELLGAQENYRNKLTPLLLEISNLEKMYAIDVAAGNDGEKTRKVIEQKQAELNAAKTGYAATSAALQKSLEAERNAQVLAAEEAKFNADERRRLILETTRIEVELQTAKNEDVLNNDRATLGQRLAALRGNLAERKRLLEAEKTAVLTDPTSSDVDRALAIKQAAAAAKAAEIDAQREMLRTREEFRLRDLQAVKEARVRELELEEGLNEALSKGDELALGERLRAQKQASEARMEILREEYRFRLEQAGLSEAQIKALDQGADPATIDNIKVTTAELLNIQKDYENQVLGLAINTHTRTTEILRAELDKQKNLFSEQQQFIALFYQRLEKDATVGYAEDVIALNKALTAGKISYQNYLKEKGILDRAFNRQQVNQAVDVLADQLAAYEGAGQNMAQAAARVAKLRAEYALAGTAQEKAALLEKIALAEDELKDAKTKVAQKIDLEKKLADAKIKASNESTEIQRRNAEAVAQATATLRGEYLNLVEAIGSGVYTREKNEVQDLIDKIEEKKAKDIEVVNASAATAEQKAAQIKIIESRAANEKAAQERRQRQIDQERARFEKSMNIARIIYQTAVGVSNALSGPPPAAPNPVLAGIIAATGAVQLAKVASQPIPRYKDGTGKASHPGGPAIVGDGGEREVVLEPGGRAFLTPDRPTLLPNLAKGAKVFPSLEKGAAALAAQAVAGLGINAAGPSAEELAFSRLVDTMKAEGKRTRAAILGKKETHLTFKNGEIDVRSREGYNETTYLNRNLHF